MCGLKMLKFLFPVNHSNSHEKVYKSLLDSITRNNMFRRPHYFVSLQSILRNFFPCKLYF